jgi:hypothetical protein
LRVDDVPLAHVVGGRSTAARGRASASPALLTLLLRGYAATGDPNCLTRSSRRWRRQSRPRRQPSGGASVLDLALRRGIGAVKGRCDCCCTDATGHESRRATLSGRRDAASLPQRGRRHCCNHRAAGREAAARCCVTRFTVSKPRSAGVSTGSRCRAAAAERGSPKRALPDQIAASSACCRPTS